MGKQKHQNSRTKSIFMHLESMEIGDSFSKVEFIEKHWERYDFFFDRSFSVLYANAKKQIHEKKFECENKIITRVL